MERRTTLKHLILFAIPVTLSVLMDPLAGSIDAAIVGKYLGTHELAALTPANTITATAGWLFGFVVFLVTQKVSETHAQKDPNLTGQAIRASLYTALVGGGLLLLSIIPFQGFWLYDLQGVKPSIGHLSEPYLSIRTLGLPFTFLLNVIIAIMRAFEKPMLSFWLTVLAAAVNTLCSVLLVVVFEMGLEGVALGSVMGTALPTLVAFIWLCTQRAKAFWLRGFYVPPSMLKGFGKSSVYLFLRSFSITSSLFISTAIVNGISKEAAAAHKIIESYWMLVAALVEGLASAITVVGTQFLQERKYAHFVLITRKLILTAFLFAGLYGLLLALFPRLFFSLFTSDSGVVAELMGVVFLIAMAQPVNGIAFLMDGVFIAQARYRAISLSFLIGVTLICFPLFYLANAKGSLFYVWLGAVGLNIWRAASLYALYAPWEKSAADPASSTSGSKDFPQVGRDRNRK